jgi:hypothetical protein
MRPLTAALGLAIFYHLGFSEALDNHCVDGVSFQPGDVDFLISSIASNFLNPAESNPDSVLIEASHNVKFTSGSATGCVLNNFLFENTHFKLTDFANGLQELVNACNGGGGVANSAFNGDSGLSLAVVLSNDGDCNQFE